MPDDPGGALPNEESTQAEKSADDASKSSSPVGMIVAVVVAIAAAFLVANMVLKPMFSKKGEVSVEAKADTNHKKENKKDGHGNHGGHAHAGDESSNFLKIDGIVVNPAATGGSRFLLTTIGFEFDDSENYDVFKEKEIKIRDALISILSSKTVTELADTGAREKIRKQIFKVVNQICQPAEAEAIYFVDFVLQ